MVSLGKVPELLKPFGAFCREGGGILTITTDIFGGIGKANNNN